MKYAKVAISLEADLLKQIDLLVKNREYESRSQAVQQALREEISKRTKTRLMKELSKLTKEDRRIFQSEADQSLAQDFKSWPTY